MEAAYNEGLSEWEVKAAAPPPRRPHIFLPRVFVILSLPPKERSPSP